MGSAVTACSGSPSGKKLVSSVVVVVIVVIFVIAPTVLMEATSTSAPKAWFEAETAAGPLETASHLAGHVIDRVSFLDGYGNIFSEQK